jgi:hypothetical protein
MTITGIFFTGVKAWDAMEIEKIDQCSTPQTGKF